MANTYPQILKAGLQDAYSKIAVKDANVLYFCTDTGKIYKGDVDFTNSVVVAASKPATPIVGKLYVLADTNTCEIYTGSAWKVVSYPMATTVDVNSDDVHVASAKAIYDAIQAAVADLGGSANTVKSVAAGTDPATLKVTTGDGEESTVTVPGVAKAPVWDADARKLTVPVTGGDDVVVNIGKDIFIDPAAHNGYDEATKSIVIYLNDGSGETKEPTKISIPATGLVDVYTAQGGNGISANVTDGNVIEVSLVLDPDSKNALVLGTNGLMLDLSAYAKTADVTNVTDALQTAVEKAQKQADDNKAAIEVLNGADTVEGSVDNKIKVAKTAIDAAVGEVKKTADQNKADIATANEAIRANTDNIAALAAATTVWGTF